MQIDNSHILLTGASGGIGRAIAHKLATKGAHLLLVARNAEKLAQLQAELPHPERHDCLSADLASAEGLETLRQRAQQDLRDNQRISAVINNAGSNQFRFLAQRSSDSIEQEIRLNLLTPIWITQSALAWLSRPGIILNIGSTFGSIGYPGYASYCAAKAGVHRFSEAMDRELDGAGVRVLYLAPRATNTELNSAVVHQMNQQLGNHSDAPEVVASHVIAMLEKEHTAKWIGWPEKLFARINQVLPGIVTNAIRKQQSTIHHYINQISKQ
ncbi:SDR family oxidoreductase [Vibrio proteolyticus]|uniref:Putative oxidoreductase n=1 Tax=Vibrio proteolyticus NBRC 13287 TaxID=1219065 RepID=U3BEL0_VIBPR|nr:SDR family oxidoreductase [Vibrio proteolyticus]GAD68159.1 putative oxidoreductase [Vibrio proteolyticus NBRC 13287]